MSMHAFKSLCVVAAKEAFYVNGKAKAKWAFLGAHFADEKICFSMMMPFY